MKDYIFGKIKSSGLIGVIPYGETKDSLMKFFHQKKIYTNIEFPK